MIRRAAPSDLAVLLELISEFYEIDGQRFDLETVSTGLGPLLDADSHGVVLLADDESPIGYAAVRGSAGS